MFGTATKSMSNKTKQLNAHQLRTKWPYWYPSHERLIAWIGRQKSRELQSNQNKSINLATDALQNRVVNLLINTHKNISIEIIDKYSLTEKPIEQKL